ncbi:hypothetical protein KDAU_26360 [Dictyobacter aurantiacus]|uniref:Uncharacterized protein n=1 Tax=Dictyobacter aurantiacus TaxID=1936993 RepID=A0A401ZEL0_9CHLR|nr:hypothetical protein KDAU_26360 [Dictyobacter aurantiacus]
MYLFAVIVGMNLRLLPVNKNFMLAKVWSILHPVAHLAAQHAEVVSNPVLHAPHVSSTKPYVPPVGAPRPYPLFRAKIDQYIVVIVSSLSAPPSPAEITTAAIAAAATAVTATAVTVVIAGN